MPMRLADNRADVVDIVQDALLSVRRDALAARASRSFGLAGSISASAKRIWSSRARRMMSAYSTTCLGILAGSGDEIAGQGHTAQASGALHLIVDLNRGARFGNFCPALLRQTDEPPLPNGENRSPSSPTS